MSAGAWPEARLGGPPFEAALRAPGDLESGLPGQDAKTIYLVAPGLSCGRRVPQL